MKRKALRFLSLLMTLLLLTSCVYIAGVSASAAGEVVYFDNSVTKFASVKCYMWGSEGENAEFPGMEMTNISGDIWSYTVPGNFNQLVFTDGDTKSADAIFTGGDKLATPVSAEDGFEVNWSNYTEETTAAQTEAPIKPSKNKNLTGAGQYSVYFHNTVNWSAPTVYMWNSDSDKNSAWPGVKMTKLADDVWEYTYDKSYKNIIFNDSGNDKTADLTLPGNKKIYDKATGNWEDYNPSPLKLTSFTASVDSPCYLGSSVRLNAVASTTGGAITYKFSANSTVIYQGSASSCAWVPTTVGNYTLKIDVSDAAGNTNSRSIAMEVKDASNLEAPFISAFANSLKTNTQIKRGSAVTFTLGALGGKVGTNLLFYKFVVTDPDGKPANTAYYTRNNTYVVTPTKAGKYTITAYVQNSYNDTVERTYEYTAVDTITEQSSDNPDIPTTPQPPVTTPTPGPTQSGAIMGDVNKDGSVNVKDATAIQMSIALMPVSVFDSSVADVNHDNSINVKDATRIQMFAAKLITSF